MAGNEISIGARGIMRIDAWVVSQNPGANQSTVRVVGAIRLSSGGPSSDNTGRCKASFGGAVGKGPQTANFENMYTSWRTMIQDDFVITHNGDGTKRVSISFSFGPTITQNFGNGGTVWVDLDLPNIPTTPGTAYVHNVWYEHPTRSLIDWTDASAGGWDPVWQYAVKIWPFEDYWRNVVYYVGANPSSSWFDLPVSAYGHTYQISARNNAGWGGWGSITDIPLSELTNAPRDLRVEFYSTSSARTYCTPPTNMGIAPFYAYQVQWSPVSDFSRDVRTVENGGHITDITGFSPGQKIYVRVRCINGRGGGFWSTVVEAVTPSGPAVKSGSSWRQTVAYVKVGSEWKVAVPYVYINGQWRLASA